MGISDIISMLKEVQSLAKDIKSKPLNDAIVGLQEAVMELSSSYLELEEKYDNLKKKVTVSDNIYLDDDGFVCVKGKSQKYCPRCWNKDRKLSLMPKNGIEAFGSQEISKPYAFECAGCEWTVYSAKKSV